MSDGKITIRLEHGDGGPAQRSTQPQTGGYGAPGGSAGFGRAGGPVTGAAPTGGVGGQLVQAALALAGPSALGSALSSVVGMAATGAKLGGKIGGPYGAAIGAGAGAGIGLGTAAYTYTDALSKERFAQYSPEMASARAKGQVMETQRDLMKADQLGPALAKFVEAQDKMHDMMERLWTPIQKVIVEVVASVMEFIAGQLKLIVNAMIKILPGLEKFLKGDDDPALERMLNDFVKMDIPNAGRMLGNGPGHALDFAAINPLPPVLPAFNF